jgi:Peptidase A4 family
MDSDAPRAADVLRRMRTYRTPLRLDDVVLSARPELPADQDAGTPEPNQAHADLRAHEQMRATALAPGTDLRAARPIVRTGHRALAKPVTYIEAELAVAPRFRNRWRDAGGHGHAEFSQSGWAGIVRARGTFAGSTFQTPATMVFAEWVVPTVLPVAPSGTDLQIGFWVGLDGVSGVGLSDPAQHQVLQAGVAAIVKPGWFSSDVDWWAWTEWDTQQYMDPPTPVTNFPVAPGDTVFFVVMTLGPTFGYVSMTNVTRGVGTSVGLHARTGIESQGASAEWIVEAPNAPYLPIFAPVTFTNCQAGSSPELIDLTGGLPTEILGTTASPYGHPMTKSTIVSATTCVIEETDPGWH